ncbi:DNA polymerase III subunit gamma/tau [Ktedonospora formicarum]|uniref:DNA polymerase III subunit gamma/tau n=1 Tax=Ktedonospora formicarum TaxID=2778364 RepID=A0A8J3MNE4_9CHLR|nr:DNA polymerase III subunit gamma/tau [Ktedonospora formicarum]GHO42642.1 DNA polymerase III, subunit gamma and tau [Ktedonospora formicarum]
MASQALYRKWRSQTFSEVVGQEAVIQTLRNALKSGKLAHAYLFTGPRGTGKTTTARLLAKTINCLNPNHGEPCNECLQCREITNGSSFNVIEIDAASNRGIDSIRELREKVMVPPTGARYKVYILDEAHMLTVEAFNALLKTLEEPPPHAIFVLATTDVHKLLPTVLSRCQRYDFKRFNLRQIVMHLTHVAEDEQIRLEAGAAELIARAAAGGMRDALSLLDQAIAYSGHEVSLTQVQTMLGVADPRAIQKFILYVAHLESPNGLHLISELMESGADLRQLNVQIAEFWRSMLLARAGANIAEITDSTDEEIREIKEAAELFRLDELIECARIFAQNDLVQKSQGTPQLGLELAFLSCVELHRRAQSGESVLAVETSTTPSPPAQARPAAPQARSTASQITSVQSPMSGPVNLPRSAMPQPTREPEIQRAAFAVPQPSQPEVEEGLPHQAMPARLGNQDLADETPSEDQTLTTSTPVTREELTDGAPYEEPALSIEDVREKWEYVKRRVKTKKNGAKIAAFLNGYVLVSVQQAQGVPIVVIQANYDFHYQALQSAEPQSFIEWALKVELGVECRLKMLSPGTSIQGQSAMLPPPPPPSPAPGTKKDVSGALNMKMPTLTVQSVHVERPVEFALRPAQSEPSVPPTPPLPPPDIQPSITPPVATVATSLVQTAPLARTQPVRENISVPPPARDQIYLDESRHESVSRKAPEDPVVQEVMRMFKADIKDIRLK